MLSVDYFTASWCVPCRSFGPTLLEFAANNGLTVEKIDVDAHGDRAQAHDVMSIPTTLWRVDGDIKKVVVGPRSESQLSQIVAELKND